MGTQTPGVATPESKPEDRGNSSADAVVAGSSSRAFIDRLDHAMGPDYEVVRMVGGGGMGVVLLARDTALDRVVAIKAIRPELATEAAVQRFLREARILARIRHPNIIPVHRAGTADGLPWYAMEYVEGETLADRLERGPLAEREAITIGRALLDALAAAHAAGVIHRDVKPANIFLARDRVLLGDFGVAHIDARTSDSTSTKGTVGTPAYMSPEQAASGTATERTDGYAAAMVIYEMLTGRRWVPVTDPAQADWTGVARRFRAPLRRALAWDPDHRWHRVSAFRRALSPRYRVLRRVTVSGWVAALLVVFAAVIWMWWSQRASAQLPEVDLVILPFEVSPTPDRAFGEQMAGRIHYHLPEIPQLDRRSHETTVRWWNAQPEARRFDRSTICRRAGARRCVLGKVLKDGNRLEVTLSVVDGNGQVFRDMPGLTRDTMAIDQLTEESAAWLLGVLAPSFEGTIPSTSPLSADPVAVGSFFQGEHWFLNDGPDLAIERYNAALVRDSTFALARWHLVNALRWVPGQGRDTRPDLEKLAARGAGRLDPLDSMLVQAQLLPPGDDRLDAYREAVETHPTNGFPRMLLGEELFHRGPLSGHPFDTAAVVLEEAVALDPWLAPAHELLAWLYIRTGRQEDAARSLDRVERILENSSSPQYGALLRLAWRERFFPESAQSGRKAALEADPAVAQGSAFQLRMPFAFDMPDVQADLGVLMLSSPSPAVRASGHYGIALADAARGRSRDALVHIDSATALMGTDSARLFAAEFRVVLPALGMFPFGTVERDRGLAALRQLVDVPETEVRAAWALALDGLSPPMDSGQDTVRAVRERARLLGHASDSVAVRLGAMLDGMMIAIRSGADSALRATEPLLQYDGHGRHGDPFARAALHILRARWYRQLVDRAGADRELRWAENLDLVGWPGGQPQAAEIDWVMSVDAARDRAELALQPPAILARVRPASKRPAVKEELLSDTMRLPEVGCPLLDRVLRFWAADHPRFPQAMYERRCNP